MPCELECFMSGQQFKKLSEKRFEPLMNRCNLRKIELDILLFLTYYEGYNTAKDIVTYKCLSKAHVSKAIDNLCSQQLLDTTMNCEDRRCIKLSVTEKAKPIIDEVSKIQADIYRIVYTGISPEEQELLLKLTKRIADNINAELDNDS